MIWATFFLQFDPVLHLRTLLLFQRAAVRRLQSWCAD